MDEYGKYDKGVSVQVMAKMKVKKLEVFLEGKGHVTAEVAFLVGNMPDIPTNRTRISVPITPELVQYCQDIVTAQIGELIEA